ncbi:MAG: hypothetical protein EAZ85_12085 [Bacteroidetes bacterium]|nr:MAG: hypothetical protein EAZ85_12085 [Bacteroidota bacterium]TAG87322.1 MAG: hypothetical protein EAZ20_10790 [Bacteroidota bacterium]
MNKKYIFITLLTSLLFNFSFVQAQNDTPKIVPIQDNQPKKEIKFELGFEGQIGLFTNGEAFLINFGGPAIRIKKNKWTFSWVTAPSLRFLEDSPRTFITPTVATGPEIVYKRWGIAFPVFYNGAKNEWVPTAGIVFKP